MGRRPRASPGGAFRPAAARPHHAREALDVLHDDAGEAVRVGRRRRLGQLVHAQRGLYVRTARRRVGGAWVLVDATPLGLGRLLERLDLVDVSQPAVAAACHECREEAPQEADGPWGMPM